METKIQKRKLRSTKNKGQNLRSLNFRGQKVSMRKKVAGWWRRPAVATKYTAGIYLPDIGNTDTG